MRQTLSSLLLLIVSLLFGVLILEGYARWAVGVPWPEQMPLVRVRSDKDIGWVMLPEDIHYTYDKRVHLNTHGFRGPEILAKQKNEYRILALGDSHIYGQGLEDASIVTTILGDSLKNQDQDCFYNVINMGVRAYSINNELAALRKLGLPLKPDHVILFFYINDFQKVNIQQRYRRLIGQDWYMFDLSNKPSPKIVQQWNWWQLARKSAFIMWVHDIYIGIANSNHLENRLLKGLVDNEIKQANQFVKDSLNELVRLSNEYNFSVTLAVIPVSVQLVNDYPNEQYQSTLRQYASQLSLDFVDLLPAFQDTINDSEQLPVIPFDGHYNEEGHKTIGSAMADHFGKVGMSCKSKD